MKIRIGFVPLSDCAPLVVARHLGLFSDEGLDVELCKLQSWDQLHERLQEGNLDGAHLLSTLPVLAAAGAAGIETPLCTAWTLSTGANAVTLSNRLCRHGVEDAAGLARWLDADPRRSVRFGVVMDRSPQEIVLREWLAGGGLEVGRRIELAVCPPPEMVRRLREGLIDGFCSGEPWNQRATSSKLGGIVALGPAILPGVPDKVLAIRTGWHLRNQVSHGGLLRALERASAWLEEPGNHAEAARLLSDKRNVNTREELLRSSLGRRLQAGWGREAGHPDLLRFAGCNEPALEGFEALLHRLVWWGHLPPAALETDLSRVLLADFHAETLGRPRRSAA